MNFCWIWCTTVVNDRVWCTAVVNDRVWCPTEVSTGFGVRLRLVPGLVSDSSGCGGCGGTVSVDCGDTVSGDCGDTVSGDCGDTRRCTTMSPQYHDVPRTPPITRVHPTTPLHWLVHRPCTTPRSAACQWFTRLLLVPRRHVQNSSFYDPFIY